MKKVKIEKRRDDDGIMWYRGYRWVLFFWLPVTIPTIYKEDVKESLGL